MNSPSPTHISDFPMAEQMETFSTPRSEHRKQAFSQIGNHLAWPTPPTELDHDFPTPYSTHHDSMSEEKSTGRLPEVDAAGTAGAKITGIAPLHSPPASPVQGYRNLLPPLQSPSQSIDRQQLPPLSDAQLFAEPNNDSNQLPLFSAQSVPDDRADSLSPARREASPVTKEKLEPAEPAAQPKCTWAGIYSIFPHFQSVDRDFFRRYRQSCYAEIKRIPAWRPVNAAPIQLAAPPATYWQSAIGPGRTRNNRVTKPRDRSPQPARPAAPARKKAAAPATIPRDSPALAAATKTKPVKRERERQTASAEPAARKRAPPSKAVIVDNWQSIPDYAPPTSTLTNTNRLKVAWKGVANDLSNDPEVHQLHAQEVEVAQILKLPANQYLANKRRIFEARVKSIRERRNFTKTAAQQACNIDVNKTSQLFEAYTRVGWFDEAHFQQWLS